MIMGRTQDSFDTVLAKLVARPKPKWKQRP